MKVTRLGAAIPLLTYGLGATTQTPTGGASGQVLTANGSNSSYWGENIARITANGSNSNPLIGPFVNLSAGSNITFAWSSNSLTINMLALASGGGGSGGPGSDTVGTYSGGGSIYIPGMRGSPDRMTDSPSAFDDEFNAASTLTTVLGALDTNNTSDFASYLHLKKTTSSTAIDGVYKTAPSVPYTVTCKMSAYLFFQQYHWAGLMIGDSTPTKWFTYGVLFTTPGHLVNTSQWTNRTTRGTFIDVVGPQESFPPAIYLRMLVTSGSNVTCSSSRDGLIWTVSHSAVASGLTPDKVGLFVSGYGAITMEAAFDWIRFS